VLRDDGMNVRFIGRKGRFGDRMKRNERNGLAYARCALTATGMLCGGGCTCMRESCPRRERDPAERYVSAGEEGVWCVARTSIGRQENLTADELERQRGLLSKKVLLGCAPARYVSKVIKEGLDAVR
jgi:hypothetical protein